MIEVGQRFERLTVTAPSARRAQSGERYWRCQCQCGKVAEVLASRLTRGTTKSCGCYRAERAKVVGAARAGKRGRKESKVDDVEEDQRYHNLYVLRLIKPDVVPSNRLYLCRCVKPRFDTDSDICGRVIVASAAQLAYGKRTTCGCGRVWGADSKFRQAEREVRYYERARDYARQAFKAQEPANDALAERHGVEPEWRCAQQDLKELRKAPNKLRKKKLAEDSNDD